MNDKGFFYTDYSVGKVTVASKTIDAGQYAVDLLNQYYKDVFEEALNYRERALGSEHLAFCRECYSTEIPDYENPDYKGNPTYKPRKPKVFEELAFDHRVSSPATADSYYRKALGKMKKKLLETGYDF